MTQQAKVLLVDTKSTGTNQVAILAEEEGHVWEIRPVMEAAGLLSWWAWEAAQCAESCP